MKAILMSIKPEWVAKILNGEKTVEVRKRFPKDYRGWVYIYCTKSKPNLWKRYMGFCIEEMPYDTDDIYCNGKVVARFWCDKVENIYGSNMISFEKDSCVDRVPMFKYLNSLVVWDNKLENLLQASEGRKMGYAIHISKLKVFDEPRELITFKTSEKATPPKTLMCQCCGTPMDYYKFKYLKRPPQSWQWVEV